MGMTANLMMKSARQWETSFPSTFIIPSFASVLWSLSVTTPIGKGVPWAHPTSGNGRQLRSCQIGMGGRLRDLIMH